MGGCMKTSLSRYRQEYSVKNFGFSCDEEQRRSFYQGSCFANRKLFFVYRLVIFGYAVGMTIWYQVNVKHNEPHEYSISYLYFTNWGDIMATTYFFLAGMLSLIGGLLGYENKFVMVLRSTTWLFFSLASVAQLLLTPAFWTFPPCTTRADCAHVYLNVHRHGINLASICIDMFISAYPIRLLHFVYALLGGTAYAVVSIIAHLVGGVPAVYEILDWHENAGRIIALMLIVGWVLTVVAQHVWFGLHLLRREFFHCPSRSVSPGSRRMSFEINTIASP